MSNSQAIAAVTTTLRDIVFAHIREELGGGIITTKPPDRARGNHEGNQVNLFLYHVEPNPAWQGRSKLVHTRQGGTTGPPLGLDLHYLITAYGQGDSEVASHRLLGQVLSGLHDTSRLSAKQIQTATHADLPASNLHHQIEELRIAPLNLGFEDMSQVWRLIQADYRPSAAYKVSVVMIDSQELASTAPPVLSQGDRNGKVIVRPQGKPVLQAIDLPHRKKTAEFGDRLTLRGQNLSGDRQWVRLNTLHRPGVDPIDLELAESPVEATAAAIADGSQDIPLQLPAVGPDLDPQLEPGRYELSVVLSNQQHTVTSNRLPLTLVPQVLKIAPRKVNAPRFVLTVTCAPAVQPERPVILLLGDRGIPMIPIDKPSKTLRFQVENAHPGSYVVRLRVNGADSLSVNFAKRPPEFYERCRITVSP